MTRILFLLISVLLFAGCAHMPFKEAEQASFEFVDPKNVVEQYRQNSSASFQLLNSVVFEYSLRSFMAIGYLDIDRNSNQFRVACLNPMGVQLFEISGDRNNIVTHNVMPALMEYGDLPTAVGNDIRKIYFDLVPLDNAHLIKGKSKIRFRQPHGSGLMEFEFAGKGHELVKKTYYENDKIVWRIFYYEYREQNGKHYPQGIVMINYKYAYQLTVRQKELYS